jgi:hypothetical protein
MKDEMTTFLDEGVKKYAEARHTIYSFEEEMEKLLAKTVRQRKQWHPLKNIQFLDPDCSEREDTFFWIAVSVKGKFSRNEEDVVVEGGLWWNMPAPEIEGPVIYTGFESRSKGAKQFDWPTNADIQSFTKWQTTYLHLPLKSPETIAKSLNRLLDALLKQLSK